MTNVGKQKMKTLRWRNRDSWEQTPDDFAKPPEEETTFIDLPNAPDTLEYLERDAKIKNFYKHMLEDSGYTVDKNKPLMNKALPKMNAKKALFITYEGKDYRLTQKKITRINFSHITH